MPKPTASSPPAFAPLPLRSAAALATLAALTFAVPARAERPAPGPEASFADGDLDAFDPVPGRAPRAGSGRSGGVYLTLAGSLKRTPTADERAAYLVLGLPLDALFEGRPRAPLPQRALYTDAAPTGTGGANVGVAPAELAPPSATLARAVVHAALRAAGVADGHARLDDLAARARKSALLPETRLRATRYVDDRASVDALPEQSRLVDSSAHTVGLEARLSFRLDRLVFADEEPQLERARLDLEAFRAKLASRALDLLFRLHRARVAAAKDEGREEHTIEVAELTAGLDALTAGWFSRVTTR